MLFPECIAKGSCLTLEAGVVFAQRCSSDCNRSQHVRNRPHHVRSEVAKLLTNVLEVNFLANSAFLLRLGTCAVLAFAFCMAGAILYLEACQC